MYGATLSRTASRLARKLIRFGRELRANARGNTYAIVAAALIPITAMIGSGIDLSRAYMAKNRLQNACDAGALAARRVMKNDTLNDTVINTGKQFFSFNFPQEAYQTDPFTPSVTKSATGVIRVTASTRIPTSIMHLFGIDDLSLNVDCDASLNFVNTEVVLVLDVTGSMLENVPTDDEESAETTRIAALREAVMALYDELAPVQAQLEAQGLRLRYGIVPYSSTVNVGRLIYSKNASYITSTTPYQSRVANYNTPNYTTTEWEVNPGSVSSSTCSTWVSAASVNGGGPSPTPTTVTSYRGSANNAGYAQSTNWGWSGAPDTSGNTRSCRRWKTVVTTHYPTRYQFTNWIYRQEELDTSTFKTPGGTIALATNAEGTVAAPDVYDLQELPEAGTGMTVSDSVSWNGCIEERETVSTVVTSTVSIPDEALDLDINRIPDDDDSRWRPMLPEAVYKRTAGSTSTTDSSRTSNTDWIMNNTPQSGYYACPSEARRLQVWTRDDLDDYVNALQPVGGTYHDIGMIWGARFISTGGIFADGCETFNGMPCNRHVIFMTDGQQTAYCNVYGAYGVERNDMHVRGATNCTSDAYVNGVPTSTTTQELLARHVQRFRLMCDATRNMTVSIWVIAFDTALNDNLRNCADNDSQAMVSSNRDDLIAQFREIGNQIGALRLVE